MKNATKNKNMDYLFFLGNSPNLAQKEVLSVLKHSPLQWADFMITRQILEIKVREVEENSTDLKIKNLFNLLGGTVKVAKVLGEINEIEELPNMIADLAKSGKKIVFGISAHINKIVDITAICRNLKKQLSRRNINSRFVLPKENQALSSSQIFHQNLYSPDNLEINLLNYKNKILISRTIAVQNPDDWSTRDFGIPAPDAKSGMLPPKLARMLINLSNVNCQASDVIYDPFCGNGRVLLEAAILGLDFLGSDTDPKKVAATKRNLRWLSDRYHLGITDQAVNQKIFLADAKNVKYQVSNVRCIIVTEPNLGPPMRSLPNLRFSEKIADSLIDLYLQSINNLMSFAGSAIFIFPCWKTKEGKKVRLFSKILDKINKSDYSLNKLGEYGRPDCFVLREIVEIKKYGS